MSEQGKDHHDFSIMVISQEEARMGNDGNKASLSNKFKPEIDIPENLEHCKKETDKQIKRKAENFFDLTKDLPENIIVDWPFYPSKKLKRNMRKEPEETNKNKEDLPAQTGDNRGKKMEERKEDNRAMNGKANRIRRIFPDWKLPEIKKTERKRKENI